MCVPPQVACKSVYANTLAGKMSCCIFSCAVYVPLEIAMQQQQHCCYYCHYI